MSGGPDVARLLAYEEIRQLAARYAVATDARDLDTLVSLFVEDVRVGKELGGRDALKEFFTESLRGVGVTILNVFASWCGPCHEEHPLLLAIAQDDHLAEEGVRLYGIAYKDASENIRRFLGQNGDPFARIGLDQSGRTGIDLGVYGVPEKFIIKGDGTIAFKYVGPITEDALRDGF